MGGKGKGEKGEKGEKGGGFAEKGAKGKEKGKENGKEPKGKGKEKGGKGVKGEAEEEPLEADDAAVANAGSAGDKGKAKGKGKKGHGKEPEGSFLPESLRPDEPFEDALREVLQRPKVEYPELQVHHIFNAVDGALQPHYEDLVHGLTGRIREFETSCVGAEKQHKAWIKERHRLGKECDELQRKAQEERGKAAHLSTAAANNNLRLLTGSTVPKVSQGHKRAINVVGAGGLDVNIQHLEKDVGKLDIDISTTRFKRLQAVVNTIYWRFLPQTRDIKYIASHYGEACGAFFRFHSTLLLISVITLACYSPLLVMQVLNSLPQIGQNWCGSSAYITLPCEFLFGGFRSGVTKENWTAAVAVTVQDGTQQLLPSMDADAFDAQLASCPVLRHVRDCRVHSVYAGLMNASATPRPYDLFTASWSSSPYRINQDYVIFSGYPQLINSDQPWQCQQSGVPSVGFPSSCGVQFGSFGEDATSFQDWFLIPSNSSAINSISFGASLEAFTGPTCPVTRQEDIDDLALGRTRAKQPSGRDVLLALRYTLCTLGGALFVSIFVLTRWRAAEVVFSIERLTDEISPIRWSRCVLGLWDFRLRKAEEKALWGQALANMLRAEYEAETYANRELDKETWQRYLVTFKRLIGVTLNIAVIFGSWVAIAFSIVEKETIQVYLESLTNQEPLRSILATVGAFAPNLVIAAVGQVLPFITKTLTQFEAWDPAARARHNLWRLFIGKVLNASVFIALNVELLNDKPMIMKSRFLANRDCVNFTCAEDQAGMQVVSLTNSELVFAILKPLTKLVKAGVVHFSGISRLWRSEKKAVFEWPQFDIAEAAVDTVYLQLLIWCTQLFMPFIAVLTPLLLWLHFKWLSIQLQRLTSRPFVSDSSRLRVALQRVLCVGALLYFMGVLFFLNSKFPHEPNCGPFDSHQTPGAMIFDLQFDFKSYLAEGMDFFARIWLVVLLVLIFGVLMLVLRIVMARRTNDKVLEAMAETSHRQVEALHKEMFRLEQKADICRKRIDWIEKNHKK